MDCSLPGSSVHRIFQARILKWVAMPSSRGSSQPRDRTHVSCINPSTYDIQVNTLKHTPHNNQEKCHYPSFADKKTKANGNKVFFFFSLKDWSQQVLEVRHEPRQSDSKGCTGSHRTFRTKSMRQLLLPSFDSWACKELKRWNNILKLVGNRARSPPFIKVSLLESLPTVKESTWKAKENVQT